MLEIDPLVLPITFKALVQPKDKPAYIGEHYPTVNHIYLTTERGKRIKNPEMQVYLLTIQLLARAWVQKTGWTMPVNKQKVIVRLWYYFQDNKRPDTHNLPKIIIDQLQGIIFVNDKYVLIREMDYSLDKENPRLLLRFDTL